LRVFAGHSIETLDGDEKQDTIHQFFGQATSDDWRRSVLADNGIDYVFWGPIERAFGLWNPQSAAYLVPICSELEYQAFRVALNEAGS
jgi:hypothetical protein